MFITTIPQSAKNLPSDINEDAEVRNETSFTKRLVKNLSTLVDIAKDAGICGSSSGVYNDNNKTC